MSYSQRKIKPYSKQVIADEALRAEVSENNICCMCLNVIEIQIYKGTGVCSEQCRKDRDNDHEPSRGIVSS